MKIDPTVYTTVYTNVYKTVYKGSEFIERYDNKKQRHQRNADAVNNELFSWLSTQHLCVLHGNEILDFLMPHAEVDQAANKHFHSFNFFQLFGGQVFPDAFFCLNT